MTKTLEVSCPKCMAKPGLRCIDQTDSGRQLARPHRERGQRLQRFAGRERWPCHREGCTGSRLAIGAKEMLSSEEGACPVCKAWVSDPANVTTLDEILRDMAPELAETHELVDNPSGPKTPLEVCERESGPTLIGEPDNRDAVLHFVPRTKPPEWNPLRSAAA